MQMNAYLSFRGDCEEAFTLYAECLGGKVGEIFRYARLATGAAGSFRLVEQSHALQCDSRRPGVHGR